MILPVLPDSQDPKTGCAWCPALAYSKDHREFCKSDGYGRNSEVILKRLYDPYHTKTIGVGEKPYKRVDVLFVGEAPATEEDKKGIPFCGRPGKVLKTTITETFRGSKYTYGFAYIVRCRTPGARKANKTEIKSCAPELYREIEARKPRIIVAVGAEALRFLGDLTGIATLSGRIVKTDNPRIAETPLLACVSPGYILKQGNDIELKKFINAVGTARRYLDGKVKVKPGSGKYRTLKTVEAVRSYCERLLRASIISVDTETSTLSPFARKDGKVDDRKMKGGHRPPKGEGHVPEILCYSFSDRVGEGVTIPIDHEDSPFTKGEKVVVRACIKRVLLSKTVKKVFQHGKHDTKYIRRKHGFWVEAIQRDTLYTHQMLNETRGSHGLDRLAHEMTGMGGYDKVLEKYIKAHRECDPKKGGSYKSIPGKILFLYAAQDADVTFRVNGVMVRRLKKANRAALAVTQRLHPRLLNSLARMEYRGAEVDTRKVKHVRRMLRKRIRRSRSRLLRAPIIRQFIADKRRDKGSFEFKPNSGPQQREILFSRMGVVSYELTENGEKVIRNRLDQLTRKAVKQDEEPPNFEEVVKNAFHKRKQYGLFAVTADVLQGLKGKSDGVAEAILSFRESSTALSTFVAPLLYRLDHVNRVHGRFNPDGTSSARLCVSRDTVIDTNHGKLCISEFPKELRRRQIFVKSHKGRWCRVSRVYLKGRESMLRLFFEDGSYVVCTRKHKIWTPEGWKSVGEIPVGGFAYTGMDSAGLFSVPGVGNSIGRSGDAGAGIRSGDCGKTFNQPVCNRGTGSGVVMSSVEQSRLEQQCCVLEERPRNRAGGDCRSPRSICNAEVGESVWIEGKTSDCNTSREVVGTTSKGNFKGGDSENPQNIGMVRHREYPEVWVIDAQPFADAHSRPRRGYVQESRKVFAGNSRSCLGAKLQRKSFEILRTFVHGPSPCSRTFMGGKEGGARASESSGSWRVRDLLESTQGGNRLGTGDDRSGDESLPSVSSVRYANDSGFLYSRNSPPRGDRRGTAHDARSEKSRHESFVVGGEESLLLVAIPGPDRLETANLRSWGDYKAIRLVSIGVEEEQEVWDIEVEGDHSYVAQGLVHHNSSADPNLQNIPQKDKGMVKSCYVSRFTRFKRIRVRSSRGSRWIRRRTRRGYILQADYSQIELRVAASFFDEPKMIEAYVNDADLHVLTALDVFELTQEQWDRLDPKDAKLKRTMTKRINFGILYGGGPDALVYTLKKDDVHITREKAQELIETYFQKRPDLKANIEAFQEQVKRDGFYTAFTGYTRRVPDVFSVNKSLVSRALRQIVNFPIQHIAAWMTLLSLCIIEQRMRAANMKSILFLTVHDSIVLDCTEDEVWEVARLVKEVMENIPKYSLEILPKLDWSWLTVPIKAELEIGESWGYAVPFDPNSEDKKGKLWIDTPKDNGKVETKYLRSPVIPRELRRAARHATRMGVRDLNNTVRIEAEKMAA